MIDVENKTAKNLVVSDQLVLPHNRNPFILVFTLVI